MAQVRSDNVPDSGLIPPVEMLHDGTTAQEQFVSLGESFTRSVLIPRTHLQPTAALLDVGCGNGGVARALTQFLAPDGQYEGVDINAKTVAWLQEHYRAYANFAFTHADIWNKLYNPGGRFSAARYSFPFADGSFDVVLLKSVFTHMVPADVRRYLAETSRVLKPGGRAAITYFLLNAESRPFIARGLDAHHLRFEYADDPHCLVSNPEVPEAVVGHDETCIRDYYAEVGLEVLELSFGDWCGRGTLIGHQDLVIARKP